MAERRTPRKQPGVAPAKVTQTGAKPDATPGWRWRTFPVFAAFVVGLLIGSFVDGRPESDLGVAVRVLAVLGTAYVFIHLFVTNVIVAGRIKRRDAAIARGEDVTEYEDEVVYPEEDGKGKGNGVGG